MLDNIKGEWLNILMCKEANTISTSDNSWLKSPEEEIIQVFKDAKDTYKKLQLKVEKKIKKKTYIDFVREQKDYQRELGRIKHLIGND